MAPITGPDNQAPGLKIRFVIGQTSIAATLDDSGATKDFASLLPLEVELKDLLAREKSGDLPRALLEDGPRTYSYKVGDVVYWPPGPHVAVFYRQDGRTLREPGMIRLGSVETGVDAFAPSSSVRATIELVN